MSWGRCRNAASAAFLALKPAAPPAPPVDAAVHKLAVLASCSWSASSRWKRHEYAEARVDRLRLEVAAITYPSSSDSHTFSPGWKARPE